MVLTRRPSIERDKLRPGEHIYSWRGIYAHHGIYVASDSVVHYNGSKSSKLSSKMLSSASSTTGHVSMCSLDEFLDNRSLYRFEYGVSPTVFKATRGGTCTIAQSDQSGEVIRRATHLLQNGFGNYNLFSHNCEDFALYCKTGLIVPGQGCSGQTVYANMFNLRGYISILGAYYDSMFGLLGDVDAEYRYEWTLASGEMQKGLRSKRLCPFQPELTN